MAPIVIEILLWCHTRADDYPNKSDAYKEVIQQLLDDGIIVVRGGVIGDHDNPFFTTEKGKAWIQMIMATPYPVHEWRDPR